MAYYVSITLSILCAHSILGSLILSEKVPVHPDDSELTSQPNGVFKEKGLDILGFDHDSIILSEKVPINPGDANPNPNPISEDRIVGGNEAVIEDHPYQVSFIVNNSYFCGGFIISENYILTAAHCAQNVDPSTVVLRAGSSWRKNGTIIPIAEVIPHPEYDNPAFDKDVAVMKTVEPMKFNDVIQSIGLPAKDEPVEEGMVMVSGWGRTQQGAPSIPERLMEVEISVIPYFRCMLVYYSVLTENELCAGNFFLGGQGTCQGDSGGPAVQNNKVVGITSYGRGCAQPLSPSVFAKISAPTIRDFITEKTGL